MDSKQKPPKEKRRNNEKRKEKSRDAARCRRSRETEIFTDLSTALPLPQEQISQLDKASIMRLAISYLKVRDMIKLVSDVEPDENDIIGCDESVFLKSMDGFVLALSPEGDIIYLSENVSDYLGITQIDLMGQNIYDYTHPCDHDEIKEMLACKVQDKNDAPKSFFLRMKCTLTSKGRSVNLKSATYKVIHCNGHIQQTADDDDSSTVKKCLVAIGQPIPHPSNIEAPLPRQTFLTKHSLDMKFTYADEKMLEFLGYHADDLLEKSLYEYHHAMDSDAIANAFKCLFAKGQCETNRYRFLAKNGGYVWVLTQATLIYDKLQKPQSVVCVNFIISGIECKDEVYAAFQVALPSSSSSASPHVKTEILVDNNLNVVIGGGGCCNTNNNNSCSKKEQPNGVNSSSSSSSNSNNNTSSKPLIVTAKLFSDAAAVVAAAASPPIITPPPITPPTCSSSASSSALSRSTQTATSKMFAPRTEEMNKGFLTFSDEEPGLTLLKDEPDDLTHLAPTAGDDVVPLEDNNPYLTDSMLLDDFLLLRDGGGGFCPILTDDDEPAATDDPFISYHRGDYSCDDDPSSQLLLSPPNILKNSDSSLPSSLNSPITTDSLEADDEDQQMSTFINLQQMVDDDDPAEQLLLMKAPYIPMSIGEDLPLLLMLHANDDEVMWNGSNERRKNTAVAPAPPDTTSASSLAQLLSSGVKNNKHTTTTTTNNSSRIDDDAFIPNTNSADDYYFEKSPTNWRLKQSSDDKKVVIQNVNNNNKRTNSSSAYYNSSSNKRTKSGADPPPPRKDDVLSSSSELLQQLMSSNNNTNRKLRTTKRSKNNNWLLQHDTMIGRKNIGGGCTIGHHQPSSDSVLMNLLDDESPAGDDKQQQQHVKKQLKVMVDQLMTQRQRRLQLLINNRNNNEMEKINHHMNSMRKQKSFSLLNRGDEEASGDEIPNFLLLRDLTQQDYEVNAPTAANCLLQGEDLLTALEELNHSNSI